MFHSSHPHLCPKSTKLSPHKALCLLKFSEWVGSKSLVCIYNFSCHWLHKQMFICFWMTIRDRSNLFRVWELFFLRLRCWKLLLSQRFSLQRPKLQKEGTHTPTNTHTSCCCLHPAKGISGFIIFLFLRGIEAETGVTPAHRNLSTRPPSSACVSVCFSAACRWSNKGRLSWGRDFLLPAAMRGARIFVEECAAFSRR